MGHALRQPKEQIRDGAHRGGGHRGGGPTPPRWPSYRGTSQFVGTSPSGKVTVFVDPTLGPPALKNAHDLVQDGDRVVNANNAIFGTQGGPVNVIVFALNGATDGTGGADHNGCDYTSGAAIEVCASFGDSARVSALFEAELSECSMGGNLCGVSTGEALSRWCAAVVGNNALSDFATAPTWFADGMPDYVNQTAPTDQDADSTGCGMAFLSRLISQGYSLGTIAPVMVSLGNSGTFAQLYAQLTGDDAANAFPTFQAALQALPNGVNDDDPFAGSAPPAHLAKMEPWMFELAGKVFGVILADIAAGKTPHQIAANVRVALISTPTARPAAMADNCGIKSRRLLPPHQNGA